MASKLGPKFALKVQFVPEFNPLFQLNAGLCVLVDPQDCAWIMEVHDENFHQRLQHMPLGHFCWVYVAQVLKEDEENLFAFETLQQRQLFLLIKELPSLGPKKAASLLGSLGVDGIRALLFGENPKMFKVPGVGPKGIAQFAQGLQHAKEKFLPLLETNIAAPVTAASTKVTNTVTSVEVSSSGKSRVTLSPALLKGLERLGVSAEDAFMLYQDIVQDGLDLSGMNQADLLQKILMKWGERGASRRTISEGSRF